MKKLMITAALLATLTAVHAQDGKDRSEIDPAVKEQRHAERTAEKTETMIKELGLDDAQATRLREMNSRLGDSMRAIKDADLPEDERKEKMKALRTSYKTELATVLTPEQMAQLKAMKEEKRAEHSKDPEQMAERAGKRADALTAEMTEQLGLSADQQAKVATINGTYAASLAKVQQAGLDDDARKERMKAMRQDRDRELKAVLTPEQYNTMLQLRKEKNAESKGQHPGGKKPHNE
jgi:Spy/CpxP family protein refolding chaperone